MKMSDRRIADFKSSRGERLRNAFINGGRSIVAIGAVGFRTVLFIPAL